MAWHEFVDGSNHNIFRYLKIYTDRSRSRHCQTRHQLRHQMILSILIFLLCSTPTLASGGVSIFLQNAELHVLGLCLILLVAITITFELFIHNIKHWVEGWVTGSRGGLAVIAKVNAELTVLGFIR